MQRPTKTWQLGDTVCDMHDGLPEHSGYPGCIPLECRKLIRFDCKNSTEALAGILRAIGLSKMYTNKLAVVVGLPTTDMWYTAAYSYDDHTLGIFQFRHEQNEKGS